MGNSAYYKCQTCGATKTITQREDSVTPQSQPPDKLVCGFASCTDHAVRVVDLDDGT